MTDTKRVRILAWREAGVSEVHLDAAGLEADETQGLVTALCGAFGIAPDLLSLEALPALVAEGETRVATAEGA